MISTLPRRIQELLQNECPLNLAQLLFAYSVVDLVLINATNRPPSIHNFIARGRYQNAHRSPSPTR